MLRKVFTGKLILSRSLESTIEQLCSFPQLCAGVEFFQLLGMNWGEAGALVGTEALSHSLRQQQQGTVSA